jgi:hypothetical protein
MAGQLITNLQLIQFVFGIFNKNMKSIPQQNSLSDLTQGFYYTPKFVHNLSYLNFL